MASLFRKLSNYRPKSRSKSPTKQQTSANFGGELEKPSSATTANHVDASFKEDGWIGRNSTTTKDEFGSSSPFQSPTRNSSNHVAAAKWNPAKGRFESPKRVPSTKGRSNDVFTRPSGYLTHDGIVSDGQIPSSSVSPSPNVNQRHSFRTHSPVGRHFHQQKHTGKPPIVDSILTTPTFEDGYSSITPFNTTRHPLPRGDSPPFKGGRISESNQNLTETYRPNHEPSWKRANNVWAGGSLMRTSHSNPEHTAANSKDTSLGMGSQTLLRDDIFAGFSTGTTIPETTRARSISPSRPRSSAPSKNEERLYRSKSPVKKQRPMPTSQTFDYLNSQCKLEGCSAAMIVEDTRFFVCKHQLSHASDFFRALFLDNRALPVDGARQIGPNEYTLVVSSLRHPSQSMQFQWFLESVIPIPILKDISEESLETCMRLSKRFRSKGLEMRCAKFIIENVERKPPMTALCWLNWVFKHRFDKTVREKCLPVVARLPLIQLEKHRQMVPENVYSDILAMKLRTSYNQAATVFRSIHKMDHFVVELDQCPRCGRTREGGKIRAHASPCHHLVGCERCMREFECEIDHEEELQAFYRCEHGLWAFSDKSEDCQCQTQFYKTAQQIPTGGNNKLLETTKKPIAPSSSESFSTLRSIASQSRLNNQQQQQQQIKPTHIPNRFDTIYEGKEQPYC